MSLAKPAGLNLTLESARLRLRAMMPSDREALLRLAGNIDIARHTRGIPHPYKTEEAIKFLDHAAEKFRRGDAFAFAITRIEDGTFLGGADLAPANIEPDSGVAMDPTSPMEMELGYWIGLPFQGHGFAREAAKRLMDFAVLDLGASVVTATVSRDNEASIKVLQKLGMRLRRRGVEFWQARNAEIEIALFAIRAADVERQIVD